MSSEVFTEVKIWIVAVWVMMMFSVVGELVYDSWRIQFVGDGGKITVFGLYIRSGLDETELLRLVNIYNK